MNYCSGKIKVSTPVDSPVVISLPGTPYDLRITSRIDTLVGPWDAVLPDTQFFLRPATLRAWEASPAGDLDFRYILVLNDKRPVGVIYCQLTHFDALNSLGEGRSKGIVYDFIRSRVARWLRCRILVCGNLFVSGPHGFSFLPEVSEPGVVVAEALQVLQRQLQEQGVPVRGTFIKDFPRSFAPVVRQLATNGYHPFEFLPGMEMSLRPEWEGIPDYLDDMKSKYRVRARRAFKSGRAIEAKELTTVEVARHGSRLYDLYRRVVDEVDFKMATSESGYFDVLKERMPDQFHVRAYFLDEELVGFISYFTTPDKIEAHFIGYDPALQKRHQLYLNILYDLVEAGIRYGVPKLHLARTAMEIKSSVGAEPVDYTCLLRAENPLVRLLLKPLVQLLEGPQPEWQQRHPFK